MSDENGSPGGGTTQEGLMPPLVPDDPGLERGGIQQRVAMRRRVKSLRRLNAGLTRKRFRDAQATAEAEEATSVADLAEAELEAKRQIEDPDGLRPGSLPFAVSAAVIFASLDFFPSWWAAQVLGGDYLDTVLVSLLLVAGLAGFAALLSYFRHGRNSVGFWFAIAASVTLVAVQSGLRIDYLLTVNEETFTRAATETALLALVASGLLWMSYVVLLRAESIAMWRARRETSKLVKRSEKAREHASDAHEARSNAATALEVLRLDQPDLPPVLADRAGQTARAARHEPDSPLTSSQAPPQSSSHSEESASTEHA